MCIFLEAFDPLRQFSWLAERGNAVRKGLTLSFFWPSANCSLWREGWPYPHVRPAPDSDHLCEDAPCHLEQNHYIVPQAVDPRPTSSAFPQRRPTAEAKG